MHKDNKGKQCFSFHFRILLIDENHVHLPFLAILSAEWTAAIKIVKTYPAPNSPSNPAHNQTGKSHCVSVKKQPTELTIRRNGPSLAISRKIPFKGISPVNSRIEKSEFKDTELFRGEKNAPKAAAAAAAGQMQLPKCINLGPRVSIPIYRIIATRRRARTS